MGFMNRVLQTIYYRLRRFFAPPQPVPQHLQRIFLHLILDIAWFGVLSGTTIAFIGVYATRQGASPQQIGLLSAGPALVNLLFALPAGSWLGRRPLGKAVFWTSVISRAFFGLLIPLPLLLLPEAQVWVIILMTLVMTIPGVAVTVGFNALFGEAVPIEWRGYLVGIRNAVVAVVTTVFTLISGVILDSIAFPTGYQIVFAAGLVGAAMSSYHLFVLSKMVGEKAAHGPIATPRVATNGSSRRLSEEARALYQRGVQSLRLDVMGGTFARLMGLLFFWHLVQFLTIPIITPFVVNDLAVSDQLIGLANGLFNITVFLGSLQLNNITARFGNKTVTAVGIMGLSLFPILTAVGPAGYIAGNFFAGIAWAMAGGALYNYILEHCPAHDRPAYLAWYSLISNAAILIGSTAGPAVAALIGFPLALLLFGLGRVVAGGALLRWG